MYRRRQESSSESRFFPGAPLRGVLQIAVLSLIKDKPTHGGEIVQSLEKQFGIEVARPVIYMLLRRLERHGLMISTWDVQESGPARRRYTITEEGVDNLNYGLERLKKASNIINQLTRKKTE